MYNAVNGTKIDPLALMAERAASEPDTLAHALAAHRRRFWLTEAEQRRHLGVNVAQWALFQLCRMPESAEDLEAVCACFAADRERLERALRAGV